MTEYIHIPDYTYRPFQVSQADNDKLSRAWDLYSVIDAESPFNLACGIYSSSWIGGGTNERRSHAKLYPYREALHAEQVAIMSARSNLRNSTLYVSRFAYGEYRMSKPCFWCMHLILETNIAKVVYTEQDGSTVGFRTSSVQIPSRDSVDLHGLDWSP